MKLKDGNYYLLHINSEKYASLNGLVESKSEASLFNLDQIKTRFKLKYNSKSETIISGAEKYGYRIVPENEKQMSTEVEVVVIGECEDDDILFCEGTYYFEKDTVKMDVVYSKYRNILRKPNRNYGELHKVELRIKSIGGKCIKT